MGVFLFMRPISTHLQNPPTQNAFQHVLKTATNKRYMTGFLAITLLATGGFMLMPFGSEFAVQNLHIATDQLHWIYIITGLFTVAAGPIAGYLSDKLGKMNLFVFGTLLAAIIVIIYTHLGTSSLTHVIVLNVLLFIGITSRMVPAQAMLMSVPTVQDRGTYMSINAAIQQLSGGISAFIAGLIISKNQQGSIENYPILGYVVAVSMLIAMYLMWRLHRLLMKDVDPT
jgi:predicted MFS family arabinose efflux permease